MFHFSWSNQLFMSTKFQMTPFRENSIIDIMASLIATQKGFAFSKIKDMCSLSIILLPHPHKVRGNSGNSNMGGIFKLKSHFKASLQ